MARRQVTKSARRAHGPCHSCGKEIEKGQSYQYWEFMKRGTLKLHIDCPVRRSWLTGSEIKGTLWDLCDDFAPEGDPAEIAQSLTDFADEVEQVMDMMQESMDNIESGIGHCDVPVYEELQERYDELENWKGEIESAVSDIESEQPEEYEEQECSCEADWDAQEAEIDGEPEPWDEVCQCGAEEANEEAANADAPDYQDQIDAAQDVVGDCPE